MLDRSVYDKIGTAVLEYGRDTARYKELGNIRAVVDPFTGNFVLLNYTDEATYGKTWNDVERASRGLIYDLRNGQPVAIPFPKFFNVNETPETKLEALPESGYEVTRKLDGSMGILFYDGNSYRIATRGSFASEQAQWATDYWNANYGHLKPYKWTLLFEIVYNENPGGPVLRYDDSMRGLHLIGAIDREDLRDLSHVELEHLANGNLPVVDLEYTTNLLTVYESLQVLKGVEGFVVRFEDGLRVKFKTADYVARHKIVSRLTPKMVRELMLLNESSVIEYIKSIPDELQSVGQGYYDTIKSRVTNDAMRIRQEFYQHYYVAVNENWQKHGSNDIKSREFRATFAQRLKDHVPGELHSHMWSLLNNKPIEPILMKNLDLKQLFGEEANEPTGTE
jgi:RNA ligase